MTQPLSVDLHILISEDTPKDWVTQALESIEIAVARSPFPVHVHAIPGVPGHLGCARTQGYSLGSAPYVTYADDDDYLLPHAFEAVAQALSKRPAAVFPLEQTLQNGYIRTGRQRHHLPFYRRDIILPQGDMFVCGDVRQIMRAEATEDVIDVETPVYVHRLYVNSKSRVMRREHPQEYIASITPWRSKVP